MPRPADKKCLTILALVCLLFQGCSSGTENGIGAKAAPYTGPPLKLALIPKGNVPNRNESEYWNAIYSGAKQAALDLGSVEIAWHPPTGNDLTANQIDWVHNMIHEKVNGILLAPTHSRELVEIVDQSIESGIPVVIFGSNLGDGPEIISHVSTDDFVAGQRAAEAMAEAIDDQGNVIVLRYLFNDEPTRQRENGILDELEKHRKIKVVSSDQRGGEGFVSAKTKMSELLAIFGNELAGVIVTSGTNADGAMAALRDTELSDPSLVGKIKLITFDPSDATIDAIKDGACAAVVVQDPYEIGYRCVVTMVKHLSGKKVKSSISTGEYVITQETLDEKRSKRLLGK